MRQLNLFGQTASESATAKTARKDPYQAITDKIVAAMQQGVCPWHKPWKTDGVGYISHSTGRSYSMLNQILLLADGKQPGEYITFKQVKEAGGSVKKGAKGTTVYFWKRLSYIDTFVDDDGNEVTQEHNPIYLKGYTVFALNDTEGVNPKYITTQEDADDVEPIESAEQIVKAYYNADGAPALHICNTDKAFYTPTPDAVMMPNANQFETAEAYYSTLFHETVHSTGHDSRLGRHKVNKVMRFGSNDYSREELVAEIGAAYLCSRAGIDCDKVFNNSVAYLQGWIKHLTDKPREFATAAAQAEKAVRYILGERTDNSK